jgi:hypothetical protein
MFSVHYIYLDKLFITKPITSAPNKLPATEPNSRWKQPLNCECAGAKHNQGQKMTYWTNMKGKELRWEQFQPQGQYYTK